MASGEDFIKVCKERNNQPFNPKEDLYRIVCGIMGFICYGKRFEKDDEELKTILGTADEVDEDEKACPCLMGDRAEGGEDGCGGRLGGLHPVPVLPDARSDRALQAGHGQDPRLLRFSGRQGELGKEDP